MKQQEKAVIAITIVIVLVVAAVILAVAGVYTEGFKHKFTHFYVSVGKTKYLQDAEVVLGDARFNVHYVLKKNVGYTVKILLTDDVFTYQLDETWYMHTANSGGEVTPAFEIKRDEKGFTIRCRQKTMKDVIESLNPGCTVYIPDENIDSTAHFKLVVTAGDGSESITLTFRCLARMTDFDVDPPNLVV